MDNTRTHTHTHTHPPPPVRWERERTENPLHSSLCDVINHFFDLKNSRFFDIKRAHVT